MVDIAFILFLITIHTPIVISYKTLLQHNKLRLLTII